ncbi:duf1275 domain containing protein [Grosmannia clavigera kw1407]|uniref:Duf1275 domain containing protein n=1 Tax=Grosmannia clavigera (strain kw1407 / UAMH 11150) TaxID=655863 RepID=F0XKB4_GROCL|nr:duf1275 domain containing protein [Grosmannia clavigera kw1407]EFX01982.1 duf1275 domain containing protein [Grosmannia clavigera kw1407]
MADGATDELPPPAASQKPALKGSWTQALRDDVDVSFTYFHLLACCIISGLSDSVAFNAAGVFVSMQTGNTIFLALGASHLPAGQSKLWLKAIVSIAFFQAGCFCFSKFRYFGAQRKAVMFASTFLQTVFVVVAAALAQSKVVAAFGDTRLSTVSTNPTRQKQEDDMIILVPIALLAFQFGGQIVMSRVLGFNEIPTNVLTSLYCDLLSDPKLFTAVGANGKRNRRVSAAVLTLCGGIIGGWLQRSRGGMSSALWVGAFIKLCLALSWLVWPSKKNFK